VFFFNADAPDLTMFTRRLQNDDFRLRVWARKGTATRTGPGQQIAWSILQRGRARPARRWPDVYRMTIPGCGS